jgi:hypothetical protein
MASLVPSLVMPTPIRWSASNVTVRELTREATSVGVELIAAAPPLERRQP